jgi:hypothetical protein
MLTGYNTDIKHEGTVYHIQTEDGGAESPAIISLVYVGGRILASRKTSYEQFKSQDGFAGKLRQLLEKQHRAMIKAVITNNLEQFKHREDEDAPDAPVTAPPTEPEQPAAEQVQDLGKTTVTDRKPGRPTEKNLDQVILEYLASEMDQD